MKAILVDLDGTITDNTHRLSLIKEKRWDEYFVRAKDDLPHQKEIDLVNEFYTHGFGIILTTGRPEKTRELTVTWLGKYKVKWNHLFMRKDKDFRKNPLVKKDHLDEIWALGYTPILGLDDHPVVIKMWNEAGINGMYLERNHDYGV